MIKTDIHTLVLPDIHGRTFWKDAINQFPKDQYPNLSIVFLGDYLDPYDFEEISKKDAIENFKEIIQLSKEDNRIHLLIGNHDMHYWYNAHYKVRVDHKNYNDIKDLFLRNFIRFNIAFEEEINGVKYLYTHAGVTKYWFDHLHFVGENSLKFHKDKLDEEQRRYCGFLSRLEPCARDLNQLKINFQGQANLWMASIFRGGDSDCGSCIWADSSEWTYENSIIPNIDMWQIFGHSLAAGGFDEGLVNFDKKIAMLDSRQAWVISNNGELSKLKDID